MFDQVASNKLKSTVLMTGFVLFVILLGSVFDEISGAGGALSFCFFFIALFSAVGSYWYSDRIVLGMSRARQVTKDRRRGLDRLFDTHPPIEERIRRLEAM